MKKKVFIGICIILFYLFPNNANAGISSNIAFTGTTQEDISGKGYGGKLIFPEENGVFVNASELDTNPNADIQISGDFWLSNLSSSEGLSFGWATFNIGNVPTANKVVLKNKGNNTFEFEGYAWSTTAGWIYFGETLDNDGKVITAGKVIYDRTAGKVNGCAWSQNIGWICLDNFSLDTTPPDLTSEEWKAFFKPFAANHTKNLTSPEEVKEIGISDWNTGAEIIYYTSSITHDFRKATLYNVSIKDASGNVGNGVIQVVANIPSVLANSQNIETPPKASEFSSTLSDTKIGDGNEKHAINFILRDEYGNPIINETLIKEVKVKVQFENNLDLDQIINYNLGDAISYNNNLDFNLINGLIGNSGEGYNSTAFYNINISSFAPSKSAYSYTTVNNDIKLTNLEVKVIPLLGNAGVGEVNDTPLFQSDYSNKNFKFSPVVSNSTLTNSNNFKFLRDVLSTFTGSIQINKSAGSENVSEIKVHHLLDVLQGNNLFMSFQDLIGNNTTICSGYNKANATNTSYIYEASNPECNKAYTSNILKSSSSNISFEDSFSATPKVVLSGIPKLTLEYSSELSYKIGSNNVKYPGFKNTYSDTIKNNEIKVSGIAHKSDKNFSILQDSNINYVGKIGKAEVYKNISKNIESYKRTGAGVGKVFFAKNDYEINTWNNSYDTIIVYGAKVVIGGDILKENGKTKLIIALKDENGNGGNIWIKKDVQFIGATLITNKSILSGDGNNVYNSNSANQQLFVKGSIISNNTIGSSSLTTPKCPYYVTATCNSDEAKKYDLNNFRYFDGNSGTISTSNSYGVDMTKPGYTEAPMIIEYDSEIQNNGSILFK